MKKCRKQRAIRGWTTGVPITSDRCRTKVTISVCEQTRGSEIPTAMVQATASSNGIYRMHIEEMFHKAKALVKEARLLG